MIQIKHILVATDFGDAAKAALTYGRALARSFGATLHVIHVMENTFLRSVPTDHGQLEAVYAARVHDHLTDDDRATLHAVVKLETSDHPETEIVGYAKSAGIDLIIMGTHGRSGISHLLMGSVAESVVRTAPCPVLTVKHPEHEFVVPDIPATATRTNTGGQP